MAEQQVRELGPAFARRLGSFRRSWAKERTAVHFGADGRGLLSDLPRKGVEPLALAAGTAVRTPQEFLKAFAWDHRGVRDHPQRRRAAARPAVDGGGPGTGGASGETGAAKNGDQAPGVQRQYPGCVGKVENGIVTARVAVTRGRFQAPLDGALSPPQSWGAGGARRRAAGIPGGVRRRAEWRLALDQLARAAAHGPASDWLTSDAGYGGVPRVLGRLDRAEPRYVAEVPKSLRRRARPGAKAGRAGGLAAPSPAARPQPRRSFRLTRPTAAARGWRAEVLPVRAGAGRRAAHRLVVAERPATGGVKSFATNAAARVGRGGLLRVAFTRWHGEHGPRVAQSEAGLTHHAGRNYVGRVRHPVPCAVAPGLVAVHTEQRRGENPGGGAGAGVPGAERPLRGAAGPMARDGPAAGHGGSRSGSPAAEQSRP